jgi:hypothetical protein
MTGLLSSEIFDFISNSKNNVVNRASNMNGDIFVLSAQKAGLPINNEILNMIVDLVNKGVDPDVAANFIAQKKGMK